MLCGRARGWRRRSLFVGYTGLINLYGGNITQFGTGAGQVTSGITDILS